MKYYCTLNICLKKKRQRQFIILYVDISLLQIFININTSTPHQTNQSSKKKNPSPFCLLFKLQNTSTHSFCSLQPMDDLLWNSSWSNEENSGSEESLFVSDDPSRCSSPPLQELQTVARILGLPEIDTSTPETRVGKLAEDSKVLFEREKSWPMEVTTGGVLFEVLENDKGLNLSKLCSHLILLFSFFLFLFLFLFFFFSCLVGTCCID